MLDNIELGAEAGGRGLIAQPEKEQSCGGRNVKEWMDTDVFVFVFVFVEEEAWKSGLLQLAGKVNMEVICKEVLSHQKSSSLKF